MNRFSNIVERIVGGDQGRDSLNGMNRVKAVRTVNNIIGSKTKGFFTDAYWTPVNAIWKALSEAGIDWTIGETQYSKDHNGEPTSKTWNFKIDFKDNRDVQKVLYGVIIASFCGSCRNPSERYDLVGYVS